MVPLGEDQILVAPKWGVDLHIYDISKNESYCKRAAHFGSNVFSGNGVEEEVVQMRMPTLLGNGKAIFVLKTFELIVERNVYDYDAECWEDSEGTAHIEREVKSQKVCLFSNEDGLKAVNEEKSKQ